MILFIINLSGAFLAATLLGHLSAGGFVVAFLAGFLALRILRPFLAPRSHYFKVLPKATFYILYVLWSLLVSSVRVAIVILSPRPKIDPGIVAVPLTVKSDGAIFVLANSITLTPGTLSLSISEDKKTLFVHGMFIGDVADFRKDIHESFERKIEEFMK